MSQEKDFDNIALCSLYNEYYFRCKCVSWLVLVYTWDFDLISQIFACLDTNSKPLWREQRSCSDRAHLRILGVSFKGTARYAIKTWRLIIRFGPVIWAPLSELYGRKWTVFGPCLLAAIFSFGTATSKDIQTVLITRFFTGFFGSAPVSTTGGVLGDIWSPAERGYAVMGYSMAVFLGPALGPIIGGGIVQGGLGWKWTEYVCLKGLFCPMARDTDMWRRSQVLFSWRSSF